MAYAASREITIPPRGLEIVSKSRNFIEKLVREKGSSEKFSRDVSGN